MGVYIYESENIAIRNIKYRNMGQNTGMLCQNTGQEQEQESEQELKLGLNFRQEILRVVLGDT